MKQNKKGFTLIELLVVIAIIGLLSTLAVIALNNARQKSRDARRVSDVKQIQSALELYYNDVNGYPDEGTVTEGTINDEAWGTGSVNNDGTTYMNIVPGNPDPGGAEYAYEVAADNQTYSLTYKLESGAGGIGSGFHTATEKGIQ